MATPAPPAPPARRPRWARPLLAAAVLLQLVVLYAPRAPSTGEAHGIDKVVHLAVFALVAWAGRAAGARGRALVVLLAALVAHAALSEVLQALVLPHRDGDWRDAAADTAGVVVGALLPVPRRRGAGTMGRWRRARAVEAAEVAED